MRAWCGEGVLARRCFDCMVYVVPLHIAARSMLVIAADVWQSDGNTWLRSFIEALIQFIVHSDPTQSHII